MNIIKFKKWNKFLSELKSSNIFTQNIKSKLQERYLASPVTIANSIQRFYPEVLEKKKINICLAGADYMDSGNKGNAYKILGRIFDDKIEWIVNLVGPNIELSDNYFFTLKDSIGKNVTVLEHRQTLAEYLKGNDKPDIIVLNSPGFQENSISWFLNDSGLKDSLNDGVKVFGCSYGTDEAEIDQGYAQAYGYKISDIYDNAFKFYTKESEEFLSGKARGSFDWAGQCWKMEKGSFKLDSDFLELVEGEKELMSEVSHSMSDAFQKRFDVLIKHEGRNLYQLGDGNFFDSQDYIIANNKGEIIVSDVELDTTYLQGRDLTTQFNAMLVATIIRRDYGDEINEASEDDEEMFSGFNNMNDVNLGLGRKGKRQITSKDKIILEMISSNSHEELKKLPKEHLAGFINENHQNLMHISAINNDPVLYKIAFESGVSPASRDGDGFNMADVCGEMDRLEILDLMISNFPDFDFDDLDSLGFNPMHRARMYGSKRVFDKMESMGMKPTDGYAAEMMKNM